MNKKLFKALTLGVLSIVMILSACKKDDSETNYFSVTDSYSNIPQNFNSKYCSIMKYELTDSSTYMYYLMVSTSSIFVGDFFSWPDSKGKHVFMRIYSEDETLPSGQYTFDPFGTLHKYTVGLCDVDYYPGYLNCDCGVVNIIHNGNRITLDFEFYNTKTETPGINIKLKGYYSGTVKELIKPVE